MVKKLVMTMIDSTQNTVYQSFVAMDMVGVTTLVLML